MNRCYIIISVFLISLMLSNQAFSACDEKDVYCSIKGGTRVVNGVEVHRDCWQYKYKLNCNDKSKNDCSKIDVSNCSFTEEKCLETQEEGGLSYCANFKRSYACERQIEWEEEKTELLENGEQVDGKDLLCASLCLDGNCDAARKARVEKDTDMAQAVGMLNALKEAKKGMVGDTLIDIFKGESEHCDKKLLSYTNCCTKMGGWGKMLGASCSPEAKNLAKKRKEKKCIEIGSYCKSKLPIIGCTIKRTAFCCYDSVIGKILNQEGIKQLGRGYGSAETPNCSGLSLEDIEKVDFSKADFREFYDEVVIPNINIPDVKLDAKTNEQAAKDIAASSSKLPQEQKGFNEKTLREGVQ